MDVTSVDDASYAKSAAAKERFRFDGNYNGHNERSLERALAGYGESVSLSS